MGLMDKAFADAGFVVIPGCEIDPEKRAMYRMLCGNDAIISERYWHLNYDIADLLHRCIDRAPRVDGIIGGPPCQSHSKLRAIRDPKFPDLTESVNRLRAAVPHKWFLFENVVPIDIPGAVHTRCNAMHFYRPHQSRSRWFTHSPNITPPRPIYSGNVDDLMAYSVVAGRIYGPKRGAKLQGYPAAAELPFPCVQLQHGLADAVPYPLATAWAKSIASLHVSLESTA